MKSLLAHVIVFLALVSADDALTAGNDVAPTRAGLGAGAISGHAVADVGYELDGVAVDAVSFSLLPAPTGEVRVRLRATGPWHPCVLSGANASCPTPGERLPDVTELAVVAG